jgi:pimeloyl-ACP methyl ester carboxylesterase
MPPGRTVLVGRHEVFVRDTGPREGLPIVLLHGWVYDSTATWHRVVPVLASRFRVIAIDLRNHGRSERIPGGFAVEELADEVAATLDALGVASAVVAGYSMGGMTAQALVRRHPGKVRRLVLAATAADPVRAPRPLVAAVFHLGRALARIDPLLVPRVAHRYLLRNGAIPRQHAAWLWQNLVDRDPDLYYEAGFAINRFDSRRWIGTVRVPTLCIIPTADQLIPPQRQRTTAALIPGATVVELAGARHEAVLTHAERIAAAIEHFAGEDDQRADLPASGEIDRR